MQPDFICFDSMSAIHKTPTGAVASGEEVVFTLRIPKRENMQAPRLLIYAADKWDTPFLILPMTLQRDEPSSYWFSARFVAPGPALLFYRFDVELRGERRSILREKNLFEGGFGDRFTEHWQLTVYDPESAAPASLAGGLIYQIFPDRFYRSRKKKAAIPEGRVLRDDWGGLPVWQPDGQGVTRCNDYFGGDLEGIRQKLPYLQGLGVTAIYLNPIFEAHSNHRYNTADYLRIDPLLGDEQDFKRLCDDAAACGISIILDGVFSHCGSDSVYFNREGRYEGGAYRDPESPYRSWFYFDEYPEKYKSWWGFDTLPEFNESHPDYLDFIAGEGGVIDHWMKLGASGWRLDVADELPDPALDVICNAVNRNRPHAPIIGEVWEDASNKSSYGKRRRYLLGGQLTSVMNYPLTNAILAFVRLGDAYTLFETLLSQQENYPAPVRAVLMNSLSTHDIARALTALAAESDTGTSREWQAAHNRLTAQEQKRGKQLLRLASLLQYFLPGTPCLYYGDEAGLYGYRDPFNRGCYNWKTPDQTLVAWFTLLGTLRREYKDVLAQGEFSPVEVNDEVFSFVRRSGGRAIFVAVNRSAQPHAPLLPPKLNPTTASVLLGSFTGRVIAANDGLVLGFREE